jgi:hypothetical protein
MRHPTTPCALTPKTTPTRHPAWLLLSLLLATACSSANRATPTCAASATRCECHSTPFTLSGDEHIVPSCDDLGAATTWACQYDLQSNGETTSCSCQAYGCTGNSSDGIDGVSCACGFGGGTDGLTPEAAACTDGSEASGGQTTSCCAVTKPGSEEALCICGPGSCDSLDLDWPTVEIGACSPTERPAQAGPLSDIGGDSHWATSCAGLEWAPPPPAVDAGGATSSTSSGSNDPCPGGCGDCAYCGTTGCVYCIIGDLGICSC